MIRCRRGQNRIMSDASAIGGWILAAAVVAALAGGAARRADPAARASATSSTSTTTSTSSTSSGGSGTSAARRRAWRARRNDRRDSRGGSVHEDQHGPLDRRHALPPVPRQRRGLLPVRLERGDTGRSVMAMQQALAKRSDRTIKVDGIFGPGTQAAVENSSTARARRRRPGSTVIRPPRECSGRRSRIPRTRSRGTAGRCRSGRADGALELLRRSRDVAEHPAEDDAVERRDRPPVERDRRARAGGRSPAGGSTVAPVSGPGSTRQLQPGQAGQLHLRAQPQQRPGSIVLDPPEVQGVADRAAAAGRGGRGAARRRRRAGRASPRTAQASGKEYQPLLAADALDHPPQRRGRGVARTLCRSST